MSLKAYAVWEGDTRSEYAELVFANKAHEARRLAWQKPYGGGFEEYIALRVNRVPAADHLAVGDDPYVCHDWKITRLAGWTCEDGRECEQCGLNDFDCDEFRVCDECNRCSECGHDSDCLNGEAAP